MKDKELEAMIGFARDLEEVGSGWSCFGAVHLGNHTCHENCPIGDACVRFVKELARRGIELEKVLDQETGILELIYGEEVDVDA